VTFTERALIKGQKIDRGGGRVVVFFAGRFISYPRLVWDLHNPKKRVRSNHEIHHLNGNPSDNRVSNLKRVTKLEHQRLHGER
jgi:hypothetical protein